MSERPGHSGWPVNNSAKTHPEGSGIVVTLHISIIHVQVPHQWPRHPLEDHTVCLPLAALVSDTSVWLHSQCIDLLGQL